MIAWQGKPALGVRQEIDTPSGRGGGEVPTTIIDRNTKNWKATPRSCFQMTGACRDSKNHLSRKCPRACLLPLRGLVSSGPWHAPFLGDTSGKGQMNSSDGIRKRKENRNSPDSEACGFCVDRLRSALWISSLFSWRCISIWALRWCFRLTSFLCSLQAISNFDVTARIQNYLSLRYEGHHEVVRGGRVIELYSNGMN